MDGADPSEPARRDASIRRQLAELTERQGWVHHVVDGDTGEVLTTPLDRPLAPLSRAERLARLGHGVPLPGPWGPVYKLTARSPYQAAPLNWLATYHAGISLPDARDFVAWSLPEDFQPTSDEPGFSAHFSEPPAQHCVLTLDFAAASWDGAVGHINFVGTVKAEIPIAGGWAHHTVDISTAPSSDGVHTWAILGPGLHTVDFFSITLQAERVILDPTIG
jgi:hypothetical protein